MEIIHIFDVFIDIISGFYKSKLGKNMFLHFKGSKNVRWRSRFYIFSDYNIPYPKLRKHKLMKGVV